VRQKARHLHREKTKTGGGTNDVDNLTPAEERVIGVIGEESVVGIQGGD